jgi:CHAD domain-containing protein
VEQLEQEVKLEVPPGWSVPDLTGVLPGTRARSLPALALRTTYYDTVDMRLDARHLALRFRLEGEIRPVGRPTRTGSTEAWHRPGVWTLKLPTESEGESEGEGEGDVLARTELTWPEESPPTDGATSPFPPVHPEAVRFLAAVTAGRPLRPIASLAATRERTELRTSDGRLLAEVDLDHVTGTDLRGASSTDASSTDASSTDASSTDANSTDTNSTGAHLASAGSSDLRESYEGAPSVTFAEVEVELAEGSALEVLQAVVDKLTSTGARRSARRSKLTTVLRSTPGNRPASERAPGTGRRGPKARRNVTLSDVLGQQAGTCFDVLVEHDPFIRLNDPDPEHVHRSRVATRRFRSVLKAVAGTAKPARSDKAGPRDTGANDSPGIAWFSWLSEELSWLGNALGAARDADVRLESLTKQCAGLPVADAAGAARVLDAAQHDQDQARQSLLTVMTSDRYIALLTVLEASSKRPLWEQAEAKAAHPGGEDDEGGEAGARTPGPALAGVPEATPGLSSSLARSASVALPSLGLAQWLSLKRTVRRLGEEPSDEALHRVRIQAKRLRYIAEVAAPHLEPATHRRAAERTVAAATQLQDLLGELHDSAVNERWLREVATRPATTAVRAKTAAGLATAIVVGQLIAIARDAQKTDRAAWASLWDGLATKELRAWTAGPRSKR